MVETANKPLTDRARKAQKPRRSEKHFEPDVPPTEENKNSLNHQLMGAHGHEAASAPKITATPR